MEPSYDYIVCGGGTSGCVVANRLSEESERTVLLLEAGPRDDSDPNIKVPGRVASLRRSKIDWDFEIEPQTHACLAYKNTGLPRGKVLGGTSSINNMGYVRCHSEDYDLWEQEGCEGWSWMDVFPYFLKSENNIIPKYATEFDHFTGGPLTISIPKYRTPMAQKFIDAGEELGFDIIDINNGLNIGFGEFPATITKDGERCNTSKAFLEPANDRHNLTVITDATVTKIDIKGNSACGVRFLLSGKEEIVAANKEVIMCCGAIGSPKLLMLSGIGPKAHLEKIGIECIADLPVGQNLQDHIGVEMKATVKEGCGTVKQDCLKRNHNNIATTNCLEAVAFIQTSLKQSNEPDWPDIQVNFLPTLYPAGEDEPDLCPMATSRFSSMRGYNKSKEQRIHEEGVTFVPTLLHPTSKGVVRLRDKCPLSPPIIEANYLQDKDDVKVLSEGIRFVKKLTETDPLKEQCVYLLDTRMQENTLDNPWSEDNLEQYVRNFACTQSQPVGTCKMGSNDDTTAVVDSHLRVHGIRGLRVVDVSIIPCAPSGTTYAPCIMIAEKSTDIIKEDEEVAEPVPVVVVEPKQPISSESKPISVPDSGPGLLQTPDLFAKLSSCPDLLHNRPRSKSTPPIITLPHFTTITE